jgi:hypothetical protein
MPLSPGKVKVVGAGVALCAAIAIGLLTLSPKDYGADAGKPPAAFKGAPQPPPPVVSPSTPLLAKPPPAKPVEEPPKAVPPTVIIIQQRPARGAADDVQSADTFLQFDTNRDGVVDRNEADSSEFLRANFGAIDTNGDGKISDAEIRAFDAKRSAK